MPVRKADAPRWILSVFVLLLVLVWGLFAPDRGFFQDDAMMAAVSRSAGFFQPITSPTRVFLGVPFRLACRTAAPALALQLLYGLLLFLGGYLTYRVARELFPGDRLVPYLAGCLVVTSTADYLSDSLVSLGYEMSAVLYFAGLLCLLRWMKGGRAIWLPAAAIALSVSLWTTDPAIPSILLTPLLLGIVDWPPNRGRLAAAGGILALVSIPYGIVLRRSFLDPSSYVSTVQVWMHWPSRLKLISKLFFQNFNPWAWGPARKNWFRPVSAAIPADLAIGLAILGTLLFLAGAITLARSRPDERPAKSVDPVLWGALLACFLVFALMSNVPFSFVRAADLFYRTQIVSRYWASLAVAAVASRVCRGGKSLAPLGLALPAIFVGMGVYGGLDRQNYYLSFWQRHVVELRSIVEAVPRLKPTAHLVLRVPPGDRPYSATQVQYLAGSWSLLLYDDPSAYSRTTLWSPGRGSSCFSSGSDLICRAGRSDREVAIPLATTILLTYVAETNRFELSDTAPSAAGAETRLAPSLYRPGRQIASGPVSDLGRHLLYPPVGLARFLKTSAPPY